ncbi:uncharacterized protein CMU_015110 [Cryptosporidium muris RN66]|uniref:Uncharacterized protein n=1 Tax=Cryptosporidium muris (strain RN66) TaxID=441375 RepID=B6AF68_CRYMR|nr:uncharacterized protein CMU_015110 [Cryptosporidium muris RN66]EEA06835.1 hypothetical protein, conserved [Cryptosporidium muris RN66]|eukprot:XP_002141184.1 hypothetical protein [Cryptosporidium muris RN66]
MDDYSVNLGLKASSIPEQTDSPISNSTTLNSLLGNTETFNKRRGYLHPPTINISLPQYSLSPSEIRRKISKIFQKSLNTIKQSFIHLYQWTLRYIWDNQQLEIPGDHIYKSYVWGQLFNVVKAAMWWGIFGTFVTLLLENDTASGSTRLTFNIALVLMCPIAGAIADHMPIRTILLFVSISRALMWCTIIPTVYIIGLIIGYNSFVEIVSLKQFCIITALDGILVALANAVDLDCGGLEILSYQYNISITDIQKSQAIATHQAIFDFSFILLNPLIAIISIYSVHFIYKLGNEHNTKVESFYNKHSSSSLHYPLGNSGVEIPLLVVTIFFQLFSFLSIIIYKCGIPAIERYTESSTVTDEVYHAAPKSNFSSEDEESVKSLKSMDESIPYNTYSESCTPKQSEILARIIDIYEGYNLVKTNKRLRNRIILLALETAMEDAMVSTSIPLCAIQIAKSSLSQFSGSIEDPMKFWAALSGFIAVAAIGIGKLSSCIVTWKFQQRIQSNYALVVQPPSNDLHSSCRSSIPNSNTTNVSSSSIFPDQEANPGLARHTYWILSSVQNFRVLYSFVLAADLSVILLPISFFLILSNTRLISIAGFIIGMIFCTFFFGLYSAPKIGFASILRNFIEDQDKAGKCKV